MKDKITVLANALKDVGLDVLVCRKAEWFCMDNKVHYGMEIITDYDMGDDNLTFIFTPDGELIESCLDAPIKED